MPKNYFSDFNGSIFLKNKSGTLISTNIMFGGSESASNPSNGINRELIPNPGSKTIENTMFFKIQRLYFIENLQNFIFPVYSRLRAIRICV